MIKFLFQMIFYMTAGMIKFCAYIVGFLIALPFKLWGALTSWSAEETAARNSSRSTRRSSSKSDYTTIYNKGYDDGFDDGYILNDREHRR